MMAAFLDENLPDGTRLRPGTKFIKYWKMRNTGTVSWNADTKVNNLLQNQHSISSNNTKYKCRIKVKKRIKKSRYTLASFAAKVHVGKPGSGIRGSVERSIRSLSPARTGEASACS